MGRMNREIVGNTNISICINDQPSSEFTVEPKTKHSSRSGGCRVRQNSTERSSLKTGGSSGARQRREVSSRARSLSPAVCIAVDASLPSCKEQEKRYGSTLSVQGCDTERPSSLSVRSEPAPRKRSNSVRRTKRASSVVVFSDWDRLVQTDIDLAKKAASCEQKCDGVQSQSKDSERVLNGEAMSHFYSLWKRKPRSAPLGRGKLELPNSLMLLDKYRNCGCETRHHRSSCRQRE